VPQVEKRSKKKSMSIAVWKIGEKGMQGGEKKRTDAAQKGLRRPGRAQKKKRLARGEKPAARRGKVSRPDGPGHRLTSQPAEGSKKI